jgi:hypothetical protein
MPEILGFEKRKSGADRGLHREGHTGGNTIASSRRTPGAMSTSRNCTRENRPVETPAAEVVEGRPVTEENNMELNTQPSCSMNHPPSTGPVAAVIAVKPDHVPIAAARLRRFPGDFSQR